MAISHRDVPSQPSYRSFSQNINRMNILRVLGLGLLIIMLKFLVPEIFSGIQNTLLVFFETIQTILASSRESMTAGVILR